MKARRILSPKCQNDNALVASHDHLHVPQIPTYLVQCYHSVCTDEQYDTQATWATDEITIALFAFLQDIVWVKAEGWEGNQQPPDFRVMELMDGT